MLEAATASGKRHFHVSASYVQIYNDKITDLQDRTKKNLDIRRNKNGRVHAGAKETVVSSVQDAIHILQAGQNARHVRETRMNAQSSRSHTIFSFFIESNHAAGVDHSTRVSTLNVVDLAGSERNNSICSSSRYGKESGHINTSLLALGNVINKLSEFGNNRAKSGHVPYRNSKLTRLLQPALGGNAKTAVLCAITPSVLNIEETKSTLQFAERAKKITNPVFRNEVVDYRAKSEQLTVDVELLKENNAALQAEIERLTKVSVSVPQVELDAPIVINMSQCTLDDEILPSTTLPEASSPISSSFVESCEPSDVIDGNSIPKVEELPLGVECLRDELDRLKKRFNETEAENEILRTKLEEKNLECCKLRSQLDEKKPVTISSPKQCSPYREAIKFSVSNMECASHSNARLRDTVLNFGKNLTKLGSKLKKPFTEDTTLRNHGWNVVSYMWTVHEVLIPRPKYNCDDLHMFYKSEDEMSSDEKKGYKETLRQKEYRKFKASTMYPLLQTDCPVGQAWNNPKMKYEGISKTYRTMMMLYAKEQFHNVIEEHPVFNAFPTSECIGNLQSLNVSQLHSWRTYCTLQYEFNKEKLMEFRSIVSKKWMVKCASETEKVLQSCSNSMEVWKKLPSPNEILELCKEKKK